MAPTLPVAVHCANSLEKFETNDGKGFAVPLSTSSSVSSVTSSVAGSTSDMSRIGKPKIFTFHLDSLKYVARGTDEEEHENYAQLGKESKLSFKLVRSHSRLMRTMFFGHGFTETSPKNPTANVTWLGAVIKSYCMRSLLPWQRVNQFPRSLELTRKDMLYDNLSKSHLLFGDAYSFIPESFVMPRDANDLLQSFQLEHQGKFIVKPVSGRQGIGIYITDKIEDIPLNKKALVSRYIDRPLLVNDLKFDLRVYVAVTSFYPLVAYVYSEGLTRFASAKYCDDTESLEEYSYAHLTNYSINKNSKDFVRNESMSSEDLGHKWTLGALLRYLEGQKIDSKLLMLRIEDLIVKSLLSVQSSIALSARTSVRYVGTNFQLLGFDVLIDQDLKPWLLEVNLSPSLTCDAPLDALLKPSLVCDLLNLACVPVPDRSFDASSTESADDTSSVSASRESLRDISNDRSVSEASARTARKTTPIVAKKKTKRARYGRSKLAYSDPNNSYRGGNAITKLAAYLDRLHTEEDRKGGFIRVFPRKGTLPLYRSTMEFITSESYDHFLYNEEFDDLEVNVTTNLVNHFHDAMMNSKKYPSLSSLSLDLQTILKSWYDEASAYTDKIVKEGEVYAGKLPVVRLTSRVRTHSCIEFLQQMKDEKAAVDAAALAAAQAVASTSENVDSTHAHDRHEAAGDTAKV